MKRCNKCGKTKPLSEFYRLKTAKDGRGTYCKECSLAYHQAYQAANPERVKGSQARWKASNPEKVKAIAARHYARQKRDKVKPVFQYEFLVNEVGRLRENPTEECVEWPFSKKSHGYGQVGHRYKTCLVHRLAFEFHYDGYKPKTVRHSCKNKACYNPAHLYPYPAGVGWGI